MVMSQIRYFADVVLSRFDVIITILGGNELASQVQESSFEYLIVVSRSRFGGDISCLSEMFVYGGVSVCFVFLPDQHQHSHS